MISNRARSVSLLLVAAFFVSAYARSVVRTLNDDDDDYFDTGSGFYIEGSGLDTMVDEENYKPLKNTENIKARDNNDEDGEIGSMFPSEDELQTKNERPRRSSTSPFSGPKTNETIIERQKESLMRMGCRPRRRKVYIRQALPFHDARKDARILIPEVVAVKRCDPECSYCSQNVGGFEKPGEEDRYYKCTVTKNVTKNFTIKRIDSGNFEYFTVPLEFHKSCECKKV